TISILFDPIKIGKMEVRNRFVRSATLENLAKENGEVTEGLKEFFRTLAKGEIGLIIPGYMYIHPLGQAYRHQTGIYKDDLIPGLKEIVDIIHKEDGKVAFQIAHAGMQTFSRLIGTTPIGPSGEIINPVSMDYSKEMSEEEIQESIESFVKAARRVVEVGADAVQLHSAHGYLINQFLSPFYNRRQDDWGGSDENRFRFLKEIVTKTKNILSAEMPLLIKLNTNDYTPTDGITPSLAAKYSEWLVKLGINAIEISCGSGYSIFNMSRGDIPVQEIAQAVPDYMKTMTTKIYQDMVGKYNIDEGYNLEAAKMIKPIIGEIPLALVGGLRDKSFMEEIMRKKFVDLISMSRPFIREPFLVKNFKEGKQDKVACISCNRCLAAIPNNFPLQCYVNKFPEDKKAATYFP
ncbi:MAG: NADH:flavin oxidoreductase, partial [Candidatus Hodarchaeota archaeon]